MKIHEAYNQWSATYDQDRNLTRDLDQVVTRNILGQRRYNTILEIGCGTGKNTVLLAQIGGSVRALDFSQGMIEQARGKVQADNVTFTVADLTAAWPCDDQVADLIVCNLVLEHIQDLSFIFAEAHRTLMQGGQLFICELHPFRQYQGKKARFQRDQETVEVQAFIHHLTDFVDAGERQGFTLKRFKEWWHEADQNQLPRLVSFMFEK